MITSWVQSLVGPKTAICICWFSIALSLGTEAGLLVGLEAGYFIPSGATCLSADYLFGDLLLYLLAWYKADIIIS